MSDKPAWWPAGASEDLVRECNCQYCADLIEALEQHRDGVAVTGDATLDRFAES